MTTYKEAGVDIENTDALVEDISELSKSTNRNGNFDKIGGFGGIFDLKNCGYEDPLLVSGTDGIGTKILLGIETDILDGLGHDLVGMCLNDILCHGAEPLFFLDQKFPQIHRFYQNFHFYSSICLVQKYLSQGHLYFLY